MTTHSKIATIVYPETDGMPLPDGEYQSPIFRRVLVPLEGYFRDVPGAHVNGNTILYYVEGDPRRSVSPDCYVVFGLSEAAIHSLSLQGNNTYLLWEVGKPPDFALEIASGSTARTDLGRKRELYAELGISEYWRYDASGVDFYGEPLVGERLVDGEYQRLEMRFEDDGRVWGRSAELNLDLWWIEGELRYWEPVSGKWLPTYEEQQVFLAAAEHQVQSERARADAADARAESEQARAESERAKAESERARAESERARAESEQARAESEQARAESEQARAESERVRADAADARLAEMKAELRRLRDE